MLIMYCEFGGGGDNDDNDNSDDDCDGKSDGNGNGDGNGEGRRDGDGDGNGDSSNEDNNSDSGGSDDDNGGGGDSDIGRHRQQSTKEFMVKLVYNLIGVLEKLFHEKQEHHKSGRRRETHRDHKNPVNGTFKQN